MEEALETHGLRVSGRGAYGGSSFWMRAPESVDTAQLAENLRARDVLVEPGHAFFAGEERATNYYRLAYSSIPAARIGEGVGLIAQEIDRLR
jgi:GntR family transcriptional regulator/MocR family aminotransferase